MTRVAVWAIALAGCALVLPQAAAAAPPPNDNYLDSKRLRDPRPGVITLPRSTEQPAALERVNTTEATEQADLWSPQRAGGGPEPLSCQGLTYGKTVWYDFTPPADGFVVVNATGFDTVANIFRWNPATDLLVRSEGCSAQAEVPNSFFLRVRRNGHYTMQIGGANGAGGDLQLTVDFFADRDGDGTYDQLDRCPNIPGRDRNGCPPEVSARPVLTAGPTARGLFIQSLVVTASKGARVSLRCRRRCSLRQARTAGRVSLSRISGRTLPLGAVFEVRVTKPRQIGRLFRWKVVRGRLPTRVERCLVPGSTRPRTRCR